MGDDKETAADGKKSGGIGSTVTKVIAVVFGTVIAPILVAVAVKHLAPAEKPSAPPALDKPPAGATSAQADSAADFQVGAKLTGTKVNSWTEANGKRVVVGADLEVEVTRRSGKEFAAEFWVRNRKGGDLYEGNIEQGRIQAKTTKLQRLQSPHHRIPGATLGGEDHACASPWASFGRRATRSIPSPRPAPTSSTTESSAGPS
jgi:hypothetical protein